MKRIVIMLGVLLGLVYSSEAQQHGRLFYNLGSVNGIGYELPVGKHLVVESSANIALSMSTGFRNGNFFFDFGGIYPLVRVMPRWYFSSESTSSYYRTGMFIGVSTNASLPMLGFGVPSIVAKLGDNYEKSKYNAIVSVSPHVGWTFNLGERFFISPSLGVNYDWANVTGKTTKRSQWIDASEEESRKLAFALEFGFRF